MNNAQRAISPQRGMTLIETMVAMTISTFLIAGSIGIYIQTRSSYKTADSVARMQETANFALDTLEEDIRLAGKLAWQCCLVSMLKPILNCDELRPSTS